MERHPTHWIGKTVTVFMDEESGLDAVLKGLYDYGILIEYEQKELKKDESTFHEILVPWAIVHSIEKIQ